MRQKKYTTDTPKEALEIARIADALSHPLRVSLIHYVRSRNTVRNDICNKDLVAYFPYSQSSLSQHVKKLVDAGIFEVNYEDRFSYYRCNEKVLEKHVELIKKL